MNIASIGSGTPLHSPIRTPEAAEVGADHDGDGDDSAKVAAAPPAPAPTVNASGQTIGQTINVKA
ncbi:MAG: hypothetical protein OQK79_14105 [Rhodanobacter sp.]|jgi:hypothetical protein|nr:hypothetical protein [Rhodanobacter sp.]